MALKVLKEASEVGIVVLDRWAGGQGAAIVVAIVVRVCVCVYTHIMCVYILYIHISNAYYIIYIAVYTVAIVWPFGLCGYLLLHSQPLIMPET